MPHLKFISRAGAVLGVWLAAAPWIFGFADVNLARWNSIACGALIFLASIWMMLADDGALDR